MDKVKIKYASKLLLSLSFLTSFITHVIDYNSANIFLSRLTVPAVFGLVALCAFLILNTNYLKTNIKKIIFLFYGSFTLICCLSISFFFSLNKFNTSKELLIIGFLIAFAIITYIVFKKTLAKELLPILIIATFITSFIGLYDMIAKNMGWFTVFDTSIGYAQSGFRYFGQAGQFMYILLAILIALKYSKLFKQLAPFFKKLLFPTILLSIAFLMATGKIAAIIGFAIGVFIFIIIYRKKVYKDVIISLGVFLGFFFIVKAVTPKVIERIVYRIESRITNRIQGTPEADFVVTNFNNSIKAFKDNSLTGAGLGGYQGVYADTEIHGTYLKMLGETGLVGVIGFLIFLGSIIYILVKALKEKENEYANFVVKLIPFFIGFLVCWSYCYPLRKLEFWIFYAVLFIAYSNFSTQKNLQPNKTKPH